MTPFEKGGWFARCGSDRFIGLLFGFSLLFTVCLNYDWGAAASDRHLAGPSYGFLVSLGYAFVCFTLLSLTRLTMFVLIPAAAAVSAAAAFFVKTYGVKMTENTLALLYETNLDEARGMLNLDLLAWVLAALVCSVVLVVFLHRYSRASRRLDRLMVALTVTVLLLVSPRPAGMRGLHMSLLPVSVLANSNVYFREQRMLERLISERRSLPREAPAAFREKGLTIVLVIGESARSANFHFNGYERETSPNLDRLEVLSFPDVYSCETNTRYAVPCLMTRGTEADLELPYRETSLVSVFRSLGFETSWLSNQGMFWTGSLVQRKFTVTATSAIAREAEKVDYVNASGDIDFSDVRDENLIEPFEKALGTGHGNRLVVVHLAGSHWHYDSHYPERFRKFTPSCSSHNPTRCTPDAMRNSYDNTILYTDFVVSEIIRRVAGAPSIVFYVSDHGEALGESDRYLHGRASTDPLVRNAATFVWVSPAFADAYPQKIEALRDNRQRRLSHDNIFHSVLDCAGIEAAYVDRGMSICRQEARERPPAPPFGASASPKDPAFWE